MKQQANPEAFDFRVASGLSPRLISKGIESHNPDIPKGENSYPPSLP